ncbi:BaeS Signal transduction histidine kinase [Pyrenophora tritici-repentis]|nr:histidine kinase HHK13p [Pyrenophora tritici-repentis]KAF7446829.1 histidine kinase HHK13p [Pyrenophora tritici-repentis]KAG9383095.1 histidine kinase HHK13p [Pyrenophora tritici-repentis]KAI0588609.1 histidine kinase HHK13p [Pyrenophora tritici-repentis]KAI1557912.1 BaeS Signal transduction histidine kinase [Pyrenophora tritici-repentis]
MLEPRSIFTGNDTTTSLDSTPAQPNIDTGEDRESLVKTPDTPDPPCPLDPSSNFPNLLPPWTPKSPLDHRDCIKHPGSAPPLHGSRRDSGKLVASTPPAILGTKRPPPLFSDTPPASRLPEPASEPLHKRRKLLPRSHHALRHSDFSKTAQIRQNNQPPSPLFFSSRSTRPQLPARFSSSEAAARMLSKTREDSGIKTVTLARGTFSGLSPPGPTTGTSARSSERSSLARTASPDSRDKSDPLRLLGSVGIVELLEQDGRPTFIVDMGDFANYTPDTSPLQILFANSALRSSPSTWDETHSPPEDNQDMGFFDWTRLAVSPSLPRHIQFARSIDWASTPLGPIEYWSNDLRAMCNLIMASPHPAAMYWGEELVAIYNEAYIGLAGQKHPALMGQSYKVAWAEIWDEVKGVFANARLTGQATMKDDDCLFMKRNGFLEETYFSWSIIPMVGEDGTVMGLYNPAFEKTRRKIAERRMLTLREVGERTATAREVKGFWDQVLIALTENEFDTPVVMLYSVNDENDSDSSSLHSSSLLGSKQCFLEGSLGVPDGHQAAPDQIDLKEGQEGFGPVFREVMKTDKPVVVSIGSGDLPYAMMEGLEWRGFGDPCRDVVICPIHPTTGENILGFLIMGINPRRPYDDDYNLFVQLLSRQLATSLASVVLFEEEIRRGQRAARLAAEDRYHLSTQLAARTQEARESETRFTRMAELSPAGLFIADHVGRITYCNDTWYEIARVPREPELTDRWIDFVKEEDQSLILEHWKKLVNNTTPINIEFRFKAPWEDRNRNKSDTWVLFQAFPEKDEHGQLKSVFGSITNISPQKWAEGFQKRKMEEAVELKRQQENFIDITSHEMRNPLSAILQCADEISTILSDFRASGSKVMDAGILADSIDAAQTIALCAQHQKRIVDDVLTLSKLDSAMLMVTPVDTQPLQVVQRALKMFEGEVQTAGIQMEFVLTDSFTRLGVDWVKIDPSRVLQVLINLTTNAIKFTTTEETRTIKVVLSASRERPSASKNPTVSYFPMRAKRTDQTCGPDWGDGEEIFLEFAVQDTGRGLSPEEKKLLFQRFSQASPRTHVQYGGSGLGLFISRELTELQGGEIGVSSEAGKGSTFAFYVKCRRSSEPQEPLEVLPVATLSRKVSNAKDRGGTTLSVPSKVKDFATLNNKSGAASKPKLKKRELKVLIVEDNLVNQKVLQRQLHNQGIQTIVANHGGEALDALKLSTFWASPSPTASPSSPTDISVVLMDKEMPVMDGLQCTSKIRELEQDGMLKSHVPIIAVTANARSEQIATLLAAGMDDVVSKPFRIGELIPKIEELANRFKDKAKLLPGEVSLVAPSSTI